MSVKTFTNYFRFTLAAVQALSDNQFLRRTARREAQSDTSSTSSPVRIGRGRGRGRGRSRVSVLRGRGRRGGRDERSRHRGDDAADALLQRQRIFEVINWSLILTFF